MAVAIELEWVPETLYNSAISAVVATYTRHKRELKQLPENIQFDVYYKVRRLQKFTRNNHLRGLFDFVDFCVSRHLIFKGPPISSFFNLPVL